MERKALFFDYDGTIISGGKMPQEIPALFDELKERGHLLFLNTGRTRAILDPRCKALPFDGYILGCGSAVDLNGETLYEYALPMERCTEIAEQLRALGVQGFLEGMDTLYYTRRFVNLGFRACRAQYKRIGVNVKPVSELNRPFTKMYLRFPSQKRLARFRENWATEFDFIKREDLCWELVPAGHTKATGIRLVMERLNLSVENCYAFGDGNNDRPMLELVPNSALIGAGNAELRKIVRYVSSGVHKGGLAEAVRALGLLEEYQ